MTAGPTPSDKPGNVVVAEKGEPRRTGAATLLARGFFLIFLLAIVLAAGALLLNRHDWYQQIVSAGSIERKEEAAKPPVVDEANAAPEVSSPHSEDAPTASSDDEATLLDSVDASVVRIEMGPPGEVASVGAGFVTPAGIVTCYHVLAGATTGRVKFQGGATYRIRGYAAVAVQDDLALIHIEDGPPVTALTLANENPAPMTEVVAAGHPRGVSFSLYDGRVSRLVDTAALPRSSQQFLAQHMNGGNGHQWLQHTAAISPGNSGGPLFDKDGRVVGVNVWIERRSRFSYALPSSYVQNLLDNAFDEVAPLSAFATPAAQAAASMRQLSATRARRLLAEARKMRWRPQTPDDYSKLQQVAVLVTLAHQPASFPLYGEKAEDKLHQQIQEIADQVESDLRKDLGETGIAAVANITLVNEFAAGSISRPLAGVFCYAVVQRVVEGDNGERGMIVHLAGFNRPLFIRLDGKLMNPQAGSYYLLAGVNQNGKVVRYGDNPLKLTTADQITCGLILPVKLE